ncbi:peptidyl-prolyl isomerase CWC27 [Magnaporthiopsis poae ATCC 64411]|uniref:peptidylprolyl isomerase n=1 Tax=Magnaporthiopsis poae (strain ATCC 64411 / 73-15) TaxID=644358 RepID=A0A0C4DLS5_MAGP6|nr:peptidyl-prolyl isomerase CWC27 [Magnaporthiopsis poae ATCC 64411]
MSAIYNTEPQPTASVILHTSLGELSVELFAKQTPLTSRNFLQHCLDGYYDSTIFHRLVPGFIIQGGDPTGTGNGGESIYDGGAFSDDLEPWPMDQRRGKNAGEMGVGFKDEFHSRLKFNRRGLLGMANDGTPDSNGSQFFFTFDKCDELNGKNTIFGRIAGDTIYNLAKMGEAELVEGGERPLYAIKLLKTEILVNPFDDMKKRERIARRTETAPAPAKKPKKRKGAKQLLSFGDEEGDVEELPLPKKPKFDARIVMDVDHEESAAVPPKKDKKPKAVSEKVVLPERSSPGDDKSISRGVQKEAEQAEDSRPPGPPTAPRVHPRYKSKSPEPQETKKKTALEKANEEIAALKASMRRTVQTEPVRVEKKSALEQMIPETSTRGRKRRPGTDNTDPAEEQKTLDLLKAFQSKLVEAPAEKGSQKHETTGGAGASGSGESQDKETAVDEEGEVCDLHFILNCQSCMAWDKVEGGKQDDDDGGDAGWMSHALSFAADKLGKDLSYRKKAEEELVVIDPREKSRDLKEGRKHEREARTKNSGGRAWDQARNAQLSRASPAAGRGAK